MQHRSGFTGGSLEVRGYWFDDHTLKTYHLKTPALPDGPEEPGGLRPPRARHRLQLGAAFATLAGFQGPGVLREGLDVQSDPILLPGPWGVYIVGRLFRIKIRIFFLSDFSFTRKALYIFFFERFFNMRQSDISKIQVILSMAGEKKFEKWSFRRPQGLTKLETKIINK